jgi:plasmid maintenance system antidote protein VapI
MYGFGVRNHCSFNDLRLTVPFSTTQTLLRAMDTETALWTAADVAGYLGIPEAAVQELVEGTAPLLHLSLAGHLRFRKADIDQWLDLQVSGAPALPTPLPAPPSPAETTDVICGYRVRVEYRPPAGDQPSARKAVAAVIARSILRRREEAKRGMPGRQISPSFANCGGA